VIHEENVQQLLSLKPAYSSPPDRNANSINHAVHAYNALNELSLHNIKTRNNVCTPLDKQKNVCRVNTDLACVMSNMSVVAFDHGSSTISSR
jgi:hypothetical protein